MQSFKDYRWIVTDPDLLGGKLVVRGTRLSASFLLACLSEGMTPEEIRSTYGSFPEEALGEILRLAQDAEESWTDEERQVLSAHIEEGCLQAERGELTDGAQARRETQAMKEDWRSSKR